MISTADNVIDINSASPVLNEDEERIKRLRALYGSITDETFTYHKKFLNWENTDD